MELFEHDWGIGNKEIDDTDITSTLLYFSTPELKQFKHLAKIGMKKEFGDNYIAKGNLSDLLLIILRREYEHTETIVPKDNDRPTDGDTYREILDRKTSQAGNIN